MGLSELVKGYLNSGDYSRAMAASRACQDVIVSKIAASSLYEHVSIKGGVLMCALSGDARRATRDIDIDFMGYPLTETGVRDFIRELSAVEDGVRLRIKGAVEELSQQDYRGLRLAVELDDGTMLLEAKVDLGVQADARLAQDVVCFEIACEPGKVELIANSKEQIFMEKLRSLLCHGVGSTRFRDLFDMYYLAHREDFDMARLRSYIELGIIENPEIRENSFDQMRARASAVLESRWFQEKMARSGRDWIGVRPNKVADWLEGFLMAC